MYQAFVRARKKVGLDDLTFHDLRHTGQTLAAQTGATLADLMKRLGHSSMAAARRYLHAVDGRDREIAKALSELCFGGLFLVPNFAAALAFIALAGVPGGALLMLVQVQVQRQTPDHHLGRAGSAFSAVEMAATVVGGAVGSVAGQQLSLTLTVWLVIAVLAITAGVAALLLPSRVTTGELEPTAQQPPMAETSGAR